MAEQACKLFVYGVDQNMANGDLQAEFEKFGTVTDVYNTGKGFAFVTFDRKEDAETVSSSLQLDPFLMILTGHPTDGRPNRQRPAAQGQRGQTP